jgi:hypothetical protein
VARRVEVNQLEELRSLIDWFQRRYPRRPRSASRTRGGARTESGRALRAADLGAPRALSPFARGPFAMGSHQGGRAGAARPGFLGAQPKLTLGYRPRLPFV